MSATPFDSSVGSFTLLDVPDSPRHYVGQATGRPFAETLSYIRGAAYPNGPVRIERVEGRRRPSDVIWIDVGALIVSPRAAAVLQGFSGWSPYPVEVFDGRDNPVPGYVGVAVRGRCGRVTDDLMRVEGEGKWANYVGLRFAVETWDGSDLFSPVSGPGPIATAPLRDALKKAKLTNLRLTALPEVRTNKALVDRLVANRKGVYAAEIDQSSTT